MAKRKSDYNSLVTQYRKLAKKADQRLVRLEKLSTQDDFKNVKQWAYKKAVQNAMYWGSSPEKPRFNIAPPKRADSLKAKIQDIQDFLDKPTSSKSGIIKIYQKRADTLNKKYEKYGLNLSWQDVGDFFESNLYKKLEKSFSSGTVVKAIATIKNNELEILQDFEAKKASHIKTEDNAIVVDEAIKRATAYYKKDVKSLLNLI